VGIIQLIQPENKKASVVLVIVAEPSN